MSPEVQKALLEALVGTGVGAATGGPAGAAIAAVPALLSVGKAVSQAKQAKELEGKEQPMYKPSPGYKQSLNVAKYLAGNSGAGYNELNRGLDDTIADATYKGLEYGDPNSAAFNANVLMEKKGDQLATFAGQQSQDRNALLQNYQNALFGMGQVQDKQFQLNELAPYERAKAAEASLREASYKNLMGGLKAGGTVYDKYLINKAPTVTGNTNQTQPILPTGSSGLPNSGQLDFNPYPDYKNTA